MDKATLQVVRFSDKEIIATSYPICTLGGLDGNDENFSITVGKKLLVV